MKAGTALPDIAAELQRQLGTMEDYIVDTRHLGFAVENGTAALTIDRPGEELVDLGITPHAHNQIGERLGIPSKFYDRLLDKHPDLLTTNVETLFRREPETRMVRSLDGNARAFLSNGYRRLDHYALLERAILPALTGIDGQVFSAALTDTRLYLKVVFPDIKTDLGDGRGDVSPGICISNSEVGMGACNIEPFTYTWLCTNGCVMGVSFADFGLKKAHLGKRIEDTPEARALFSQRTLDLDDAAFFAQVTDVVKGAAGGISWMRITERLQELAGLAVPGDPVQAVEKLAKSYQLNEGERGSIMQHLIKGGDLTAYGYIQAVTRTAEDAESYDRAYELERLGGQLVEVPVTQWAAMAA